MGILDVNWRCAARLGFADQGGGVSGVHRPRKPRRTRLIEGFNEWMARCGLEYAGHPKDEFITNTGYMGQMDLSCTVRFQIFRRAK